MSEALSTPRATRTHPPDFTMIGKYPASVVKAYGDQFDHFPRVLGTIVVSNFTEDDWRNLQDYFDDCHDLNRVQFEYVPHKLELTTMSYTECHHRVVALVKDVQIQMWSRFSAQCGMPKWFHDIRFMIAASGPKYTTLWSVPADKKIPVDNLNRFIISGRTVQSYMTSIFEVVKSQGLYTPNAKTTKTLNKDGALNKCLDVLLDGLDGHLIDVDVIVLEEVVENGTMWSYEGADHPYILEELHFDPAVFARIQAAETEPLLTGFLPGIGPLVAPSHTPGCDQPTAFVGAFRGFLIHIPAHDPKALSLLSEAVQHRRPIQWWLNTPYAIRILDKYEPNEEERVKTFFDMVWGDYLKKAALVSSVLHSEQTIRQVVQLLKDKGNTRNITRTRMDEFITYAHTLLRDDLERPREFVDFISYLICECKQGARDTAASRLMDHTTVPAFHPAYDDVIFDPDKPFDEILRDMVAKAYGEHQHEGSTDEAGRD